MCDDQEVRLDRLDSEYLWEGEEMMYEDIVASTHPLSYNPMAVLSRKHPDNFFSAFFARDLLQDEDEEEHPLADQVELQQAQVVPCQASSCGGRNQEAEEEQFGLDSTIISGAFLDLNQSMLGLPLNDFNFDMLDLENGTGYEASFFFNSM